MDAQGHTASGGSRASPTPSDPYPCLGLPLPQAPLDSCNENHAVSFGCSGQQSSCVQCLTRERPHCPNRGLNVFHLILLPRSSG